MTAPRPADAFDLQAQQLHALLETHLAELGLAEDVPPTPEQWTKLLDTLDAQYRRHDLNAGRTGADLQGWSSFQNLFHHTPVPLIEQDYSALMAWMEELRSEGVTDIREYIGEDIDQIRAVAHKIDMVAANPAAVQAVGIAHRKLIGPVDPIIINEGSLAGWVAQFDAVWRGKPVVHASIEAATAGGIVYDAETILAAPLVDGVPDFSRAVFTIFDVSERRAEERRMLGLMEAKNQFLASVSHEIRTPLTAVVGFAQILDEQFDLMDGDDGRLMVSAIAQHSREVSNLVEDLLVAARVEAGQIEVSQSPVDVTKQLHTVLTDATVAIDVEIEPGPPVFALGDARRVRQILRNLLTNAERYGGEHVTAYARVAGSAAEIEICDDGPGLPVSDWDRIFEPYHKAHRIKGQPESVGIGLAVSRQLAELMRGTLDYRYADGHSIFRLTLPAG